MLACVVDIEFAWGYQCNVIGLSRSPTPYLYPPPSTFLGAIAESLAKKYGLGEDVIMSSKVIKELSVNLCAIAFRPLNFVPTKSVSLERIIAIKITGGKLYPTPADITASFDAVKRGLTLASPLEDSSPTIRLIVVFKENTITINSKSIKLSDDIMWHMHRLGSRESIISVTSVYSTNNVRSYANSKILTRYCFPEALGVKLLQASGIWKIESYVNPYDLSRPVIFKIIEQKDLIPYRVPVLTSTIREPKSLVGFNGKWCAYEIEYDGEREAIIGLVR